MNERIRLLADQCRWQEVVVEDGEEWIHAHFDEAKFADLIIRECLKMCLTSVGNKDYNTGRMHCHDNIKEHFGVG